MTNVRDSDSANAPRVQLTTDAVIAAYIHEISARHASNDQDAQSPSGPPPTD